ncbi:hypothetical protein ADUPG1_008170 [Aduncisulcus paluster]|uniref:EGF-like domain-containing protein n=1 Tax=Aduncisulcus paluster TaxID=2918883 RepID=A0ABQ5KR03_9EUKA|nr:hypothetical protein ADUPG1_008170 [Aduncisulcus paluster]
MPASYYHLGENVACSNENLHINNLFLSAGICFPPIDSLTLSSSSSFTLSSGALNASKRLLPMPIPIGLGFDFSVLHLNIDVSSSDSLEFQFSRFDDVPISSFTFSNLPHTLSDTSVLNVYTTETFSSKGIVLQVGNGFWIRLGRMGEVSVVIACNDDSTISDFAIISSDGPTFPSVLIEDHRGGPQLDISLNPSKMACPVAISSDNEDLYSSETGECISFAFMRRNSLILPSISSLLADTGISDSETGECISFAFMRRNSLILPSISSLLADTGISEYGQTFVDDITAFESGYYSIANNVHTLLPSSIIVPGLYSSQHYITNVYASYCSCDSPDTCGDYPFITSPIGDVCESALVNSGIDIIHFSSFHTYYDFSSVSFIFTSTDTLDASFSRDKSSTMVTTTLGAIEDHMAVSFVRGDDLESDCACSTVYNGDEIKYLACVCESGFLAFSSFEGDCSIDLVVGATFVAHTVLSQSSVIYIPATSLQNGSFTSYSTDFSVMDSLWIEEQSEEMKSNGMLYSETGVDVSLGRLEISEYDAINMDFPFQCWENEDSSLSITKTIDSIKFNCSCSDDLEIVSFKWILLSECSSADCSIDGDRDTLAVIHVDGHATVAAIDSAHCICDDLDHTAGYFDDIGVSSVIGSFTKNSHQGMKAYVFVDVFGKVSVFVRALISADASWTNVLPMYGVSVSIDIYSAPMDRSVAPTLSDTMFLSESDVLSKYSSLDTTRPLIHHFSLTHSHKNGIVFPDDYSSSLRVTDSSCGYSYILALESIPLSYAQDTSAFWHEHWIPRSQVLESFVANEYTIPTESQPTLAIPDNIFEFPFPIPLPSYSITDSYATHAFVSHNDSSFVLSFCSEDEDNVMAERFRVRLKGSFTEDCVAYDVVTVYSEWNGGSIIDIDDSINSSTTEILNVSFLPSHPSFTDYSPLVFSVSSTGYISVRMNIKDADARNNQYAAWKIKKLAVDIDIGVYSNKKWVILSSHSITEQTSFIFDVNPYYFGYDYSRSLAIVNSNRCSDLPCNHGVCSFDSLVDLATNGPSSVTSSVTLATHDTSGDYCECSPKYVQSSDGSCSDEIARELYAIGDKEFTQVISLFNEKTTYSPYFFEKSLPKDVIVSGTLAYNEIRPHLLPGQRLFLFGELYSQFYVETNEYPTQLANMVRLGTTGVVRIKNVGIGPSGGGLGTSDIFLQQYLSGEFDVSTEMIYAPGEDALNHFSGSNHDLFFPSDPVHTPMEFTVSECYGSSDMTSFDTVVDDCDFAIQPGVALPNARGLSIQPYVRWEEVEGDAGVGEFGCVFGGRQDFTVSISGLISKEDAKLVNYMTLYQDAPPPTHSSLFPLSENASTTHESPLLWSGHWLVLWNRKYVEDDFGNEETIDSPLVAVHGSYAGYFTLIANIGPPTSSSSPTTSDQEYLYFSALTTPTVNGTEIDDTFVVGGVFSVQLAPQSMAPASGGVVFTFFSSYFAGMWPAAATHSKMCLHGVWSSTYSICACTSFAFTGEFCEEPRCSFDAPMNSVTDSNIISRDFTVFNAIDTDNSISREIDVRGVTCIALGSNSFKYCQLGVNVTSGNTLSLTSSNTRCTIGGFGGHIDFFGMAVNNPPVTLLFGSTISFYGSAFNLYNLISDTVSGVVERGFCLDVMGFLPVDVSNHSNPLVFTHILHPPTSVSMVATTDIASLDESDPNFGTILLPTVVSLDDSELYEHVIGRTFVLPVYTPFGIGIATMTFTIPATGQICGTYVGSSVTSCIHLLNNILPDGELLSNLYLKGLGYSSSSNSGLFIGLWIVFITDAGSDIRIRISRGGAIDIYYITGTQNIYPKLISNGAYNIGITPHPLSVNGGSGLPPGGAVSFIQMSENSLRYQKYTTLSESGISIPLSLSLVEDSEVDTYSEYSIVSMSSSDSTSAALLVSMKCTNGSLVSSSDGTVSCSCNEHWTGDSCDTCSFAYWGDEANDCITPNCHGRCESKYCYAISDDTSVCGCTSADSTFYDIDSSPFLDVTLSHVNLSNICNLLIDSHSNIRVSGIDIHGSVIIAEDSELGIESSVVRVKNTQVQFQNVLESALFDEEAPNALSIEYLFNDYSLGHYSKRLTACIVKSSSDYEVVPSASKTNDSIIYSCSPDYSSLISDTTFSTTINRGGIVPDLSLIGSFSSSKCSSDSSSSCIVSLPVWKFPLLSYSVSFIQVVDGSLFFLDDDGEAVGELTPINSEVSAPYYFFVDENDAESGCACCAHRIVIQSTIETLSFLVEVQISLYRNGLVRFEYSLPDAIDISSKVRPMLTIFSSVGEDYEYSPSFPDSSTFDLTGIEGCEGLDLDEFGFDFMVDIVPQMNDDTDSDSAFSYFDIQPLHCPSECVYGVCVQDNEWDIKNGSDSILSANESRVCECASRYGGELCTECKGGWEINSLEGDIENPMSFFDTSGSISPDVCTIPSCSFYSYCNDHGTCTGNKLTGLQECSCEGGYQGDSCSVASPLVECDPSCENGGICYSGICFCADGYSGESCADMDCPNGCSENIEGGECNVSTGACVCNSGFSGDSCDNYTPDGSCVYGVSNGAGCTCFQGYGGDYCQCYLNCSGKGLCMEFGCDCDDGFGGDYCELIMIPSINDVSVQIEHKRVRIEFKRLIYINDSEYETYFTSSHRSVIGTETVGEDISGEWFDCRSLLHEDICGEWDLASNFKPLVEIESECFITTQYRETDEIISASNVDIFHPLYSVIYIYPSTFSTLYADDLILKSSVLYDATSYRSSSDDLVLTLSSDLFRVVAAPTLPTLMFPHSLTFGVCDDDDTVQVRSFTINLYDIVYFEGWGVLDFIIIVTSPEITTSSDYYEDIQSVLAKMQGIFLVDSEDFCDIHSSTQFELHSYYLTDLWNYGVRDLTITVKIRSLFSDWSSDSYDIKLTTSKIPSLIQSYYLPKTTTKDLLVVPLDVIYDEYTCSNSSVSSSSSADTLYPLTHPPSSYVDAYLPFLTMEYSFSWECVNDVTHTSFEYFGGSTLFMNPGYDLGGDYLCNVIGEKDDGSVKFSFSVPFSLDTKNEKVLVKEGCLLAPKNQKVQINVQGRIDEEEDGDQRQGGWQVDNLGISGDTVSHSITSVYTSENSSVSRSLSVYIDSYTPTGTQLQFIHTDVTTMAVSDAHVTVVGDDLPFAVTIPSSSDLSGKHSLIVPEISVSKGNLSDLEFSWELLADGVFSDYTDEERQEMLDYLVFSSNSSPFLLFTPSELVYRLRAYSTRSLPLQLTISSLSDESTATLRYDHSIQPVHSHTQSKIFHSVSPELYDGSEEYPFLCEDIGYSIRDYDGNYCDSVVYYIADDASLGYISCIDEEFSAAEDPVKSSNMRIRFGSLTNRSNDDETGMVRKSLQINGVDVLSTFDDEIDIIISCAFLSNFIADDRSFENPLGSQESEGEAVSLSLSVVYSNMIGAVQTEPMEIYIKQRETFLLPLYYGLYGISMSIPHRTGVTTCYLVQIEIPELFVQFKKAINAIDVFEAFGVAEQIIYLSTEALDIGIFNDYFVNDDRGSTLGLVRLALNNLLDLSGMLAAFVDNLDDTVVTINQFMVQLLTQSCQVFWYYYSFFMEQLGNSGDSYELDAKTTLQFLDSYPELSLIPQAESGREWDDFMSDFILWVSMCSHLIESNRVLGSLNDSDMILSMVFELLDMISECQEEEEEEEGSCSNSPFLSSMFGGQSHLLLSLTSLIHDSIHWVYVGEEAEALGILGNGYEWKQWWNVGIGEQHHPNTYSSSISGAVQIYDPVSIAHDDEIAVINTSIAREVCSYCYSTIDQSIDEYLLSLESKGALIALEWSWSRVVARKTRSSADLEDDSLEDVFIPFDWKLSLEDAIPHFESLDLVADSTIDDVYTKLDSRRKVRDGFTMFCSTSDSVEISENACGPSDDDDYDIVCHFDHVLYGCVVTEIWVDHSSNLLVLYVVLACLFVTIVGLIVGICMYKKSQKKKAKQETFVMRHGSMNLSRKDSATPLFYQTTRDSTLSYSGDMTIRTFTSAPNLLGAVSNVNSRSKNLNEAH